jgi:hypothetical protein
MPKVKISEYSATANSNTDVASINIDEGCAPSGINNAIRAVMGHLKDFQQGTYGDPFNGPHNGTVGATTPSTGAFTTLSATGVTTVQAGTAAAPAITTTGDTNTGIFFPAADTIAFAEGGAEVARFDSSGNFGLGVTPSAWASAYKVLDVGTTGSVYYDSSGVAVSNNAFINSSFSYRYKTTSYASRYEQTSAGQHQWYNAASGTAGNAITFTQAMTLDGSGNLGIGQTSMASDTRLHLTKTTDNCIAKIQSSFGAELQLINGGGSELSIINATGNNVLSLRTGSTERARIDSSGNLLVGATSGVVGSERLSISSGSQRGAVLKNSSSGSELIGCWNSATTGDNGFAIFWTEASPNQRGSISYNRAGGLVAYNTTSDYRAKDISGPVTGSGSLIDSVPVYMGTMKGATQERPMFIAHETPDYAHTGEKDAVDADGKPVYQQMDASALVPVMWAEIQSLRKRLAALESA